MRITVLQYPHKIEAITWIDFVPVWLHSLFQSSQNVSNIYKQLLNRKKRYKLYSSSRRHIPFFLRGRLHKEASEQIRIEVSHIRSFHIQLYRWFLWLNHCRFGDQIDTLIRKRCVFFLKRNMKIGSTERCILHKQVLLICCCICMESSLLENCNQLFVVKFHS
jgi:hypothetical protein